MQKRRKWEDIEIEFPSIPDFGLRLVVIQDGDDEFSYVTKNLLDSH
jgi:hypothetical protein